MRARYHRPALLGYYLLLLLQLCCCAAEVTFPTTAEVDLIFPRNDTYAPSAIFPVVLAVQNAHAAVALEPNIRWSIDRFIPPSNATSSPGGMINLMPANLSNSDLYLAFGGLYGHLNMEGTWRLSWTVLTTDCDRLFREGHRDIATSGRPVLSEGGTVFFSIKNGAQQPDIVAPTAQDTCADAQSVTYHVRGPRTRNGSSCVVHSLAFSAAADPCRVKLDPSTASSISASLTATACAAPNPVVSCPGSSSQNTAGAPQSTSGASQDTARGGGQRLAAGGSALFKLTAAWVALCYFLL